MAPTANRTFRTLQPSALTVALLLALGTAHAQVRVEATSDTIRGRAPAVVFRAIQNQTVPGQAPAVGHALRVEADASDADGDTVTGVTYRWRRDGAEIATGTDYVPVPADAGRTLVVEATATTDAATTDPATATATLDVVVAANSAPSVSNVDFSGTYAVGQTLTGTYTFVDAESDPEDAAGMEYAWYATNRDSGALVQVGTGRTYVLRGEDQGPNQTVVFSVEKARAQTGTPNEQLRPTSPAGQWQRSRTGLQVTGRAPVATNVGIDGTPQVGQVLTARYDFNDPDGDAEFESSLTWFRASDASGSPASIVGAQVGSGATYTVQAADQGFHLVLYVIPRTNNTLLPTSGEGVFVATATAVGGSAPTVLTTTINGTWRAGETLTAEYDYDDADNDQEDVAARQLQWYVSDPSSGAPTAVSGATGLTFTLRAADVGNRTVWFNVEKVASQTGVPNETTRPVGAGVGTWFARRTGLIEGRAPTMTTPTITGTVATGQVLTGVPAGFADLDGDLAGTHTYKWYRADDAAGTINKTVIATAISATYTATGADVGKYLVFEVTPVSATGTPNTGEPVSRVTATAVSGTAPTVASLAISGTYAVGQTLTGSYTYADAENDAEDTSASGTRYQWYVSDPGTGSPTAVAGATGKTYVIRAADQGASRRIWFNVESVRALTGVPNERTGPWGASRLGEVSGTAPTVDGFAISGTYNVGETLTGSYTYADADNDAEDTSASGTRYQWYVSNPSTGVPEAVTGATGKTYVIRAADQGASRRIWFNVESVRSATGTPNERIGPWGASRLGAVNGRAPTMTAPTITGTLATGQVLTGVPAGFVDLDGDAAGTHTYKWYRADDAAGTTNKTVIATATSTTYTVAAADVGKFLVFEVTPVSSAGTPNTGEPVSRVTATAVPGTAPTVDGFSISGTFEVGQTLTGHYTYTDADGDPEDTSASGTRYQWYRSDLLNGSPILIVGAVGKTHTLGGDDQGENRRIWFNVESVRSTTGEPKERVGPWGASRLGPVTGRAPTMTTPTLSGTVALGQVLTGTPNGYADLDGDPPGIHTYKWYRADDAAGTINKTVIAGAVSTTYTIATADHGKYLVFEVTPVSMGPRWPQSGTPVSRVTATAVPGAPPVASNLSISGAVPLDRGQTYEAMWTYTDAESDPAGTPTYEWFTRRTPPAR